MKCGSVWQEPASQPGNNLNLILLVSDTFRRDNLECFSSRRVECPNLNQFARDSIIFEDSYQPAAYGEMSLLLG
jgi:arylsulfatase A-like enzyme